MKSVIRDINLADSGNQKIEWVKMNMPLLSGLEEEFAKTRPFDGVKISVSVHLEAKTAYLARVLAAGGAIVSVTGSNPLSTQDDIAAALAAGGLDVFAWHDPTEAEYLSHIEMAVDNGPNIVIDDGGDLLNMLHTKRAELLSGVWGGCEETTTGIMRLRAMEADGALKFPMIAVNNAYCKHLFDNRHGTGQSVWDGINRTTNLIVAGKQVVVGGYGYCSKGIAQRAKGLGALVTVTEVDPIRALEAVMDGFSVMPMDDAAKIGDVFVTATGCEGLIQTHHFETMKNGALLANAGHFDCEIDVKALEEMAVSKKELRKNIMGYVMPNGRTLCLLGGGRLVNLACGDGHPAEIMDMSFAVQALSAKYVLDNKGKLPVSVIDVPREIDMLVAELKLAADGIKIDKLTEKQKDYLGAWN